MDDALSTFIQKTETEFKPLNIARTHAIWEASINGTPEANERAKETQAAVLRYWADPIRFSTAKKFMEDGIADDPIEARQLQIIYLNAAKAQQDEETIGKITQLESEIRQTYTNFRAQIDGETLSNNELENILTKSDDSEKVRKAWEASKQIGPEVAENIRELAKLRNLVAQKQGFRDFFHKSLTLNEIDEDHLMRLFSELDEVTTEPFKQLKAEIDQTRANHFEIREGELYPWHYGDPFFQSAPEIYDLDMDEYFAGKNPTVLATITCDGLGLDVRDILERSDLYPRPGKDQHAFSIDLDREGDIRTLNNLEPNYRWNSTLLHELGHAIYNKYIDRDLPWLLRLPPHSLSTEAVAFLMGSLTNDREWLSQILGLSEENADQIARVAAMRECASHLIFTRWCLVITTFERRFYADPEQDLNTLWWDLVERFQFLRRPPGRNAPDWASKYHIALFPVYYQNYELGHLVTAQLQHTLQREVGGLVGNKDAGSWIVERVLRQGATEDWAKHVESATGEPLNTRYFVETVM
jgi:peptidyl-dipeptidase A